MAECGHTVRNGDPGHFGAVRECLTIELDHGVRDHIVSRQCTGGSDEQRLILVEEHTGAIAAIIFIVCVHPDPSQTGTTIKRSIDHRHAGGDADGGQAGAKIKRTTPNLKQTVRQNDTIQIVTVIERITVDIGDAVGDIDAFQTRAVGKGPVSDLRHAVRQDHMLQSTVFKGGGPDARHALRDRYTGDAVTSPERGHADGGDTIFDLDGLDLLLIGIPGGFALPVVVHIAGAGDDQGPIQGQPPGQVIAAGAVDHGLALDELVDTVVEVTGAVVVVGHGVAAPGAHVPGHHGALVAVLLAVVQVVLEFFVVGGAGGAAELHLHTQTVVAAQVRALLQLGQGVHIIEGVVGLHQGVVEAVFRPVPVALGLIEGQLVDVQVAADGAVEGRLGVGGGGGVGVDDLGQGLSRRLGDPVGGLVDRLLIVVEAGQLQMLEAGSLPHGHRLIDVPLVGLGPVLQSLFLRAAAVDGEVDGLAVDGAPVILVFHRRVQHQLHAHLVVGVVEGGLGAGGSGLQSLQIDHVVAVVAQVVAIHVLAEGVAQPFVPVVLIGVVGAGGVAGLVGVEGAAGGVVVAHDGHVVEQPVLRHAIFIDIGDGGHVLLLGLVGVVDLGAVGVDVPAGVGHEFVAHAAGLGRIREVAHIFLQRIVLGAGLQHRGVVGNGLAAEDLQLVGQDVDVDREDQLDVACVVVDAAGGVPAVAQVRAGDVGIVGVGGGLVVPGVRHLIVGHAVVGQVEGHVGGHIEAHGLQRREVHPDAGDVAQGAQIQRDDTGVVAVDLEVLAHDGAGAVPGLGSPVGGVGDGGGVDDHAVGQPAVGG